MQVVQIVLWYLDSGCFMNFMKKFIGTVRLRNDHFGTIMGYEDYVIRDSVISRVYYVEGLGHNLFFVGQFRDSDLEVAFRKHSCYVRDTDGVELLKGSRGSNLYTISVKDMMKSSPICVKSYQKKLNLTNSDTYRFDLKRKEAYTAYSNPRGFTYQNKDKQNSDGTLNDVRTALDDRLKGIRMKYLPQAIWRRSDKERAAAMI
nr:copia protein [Tanacetum cinerariifolium]